MAPTPRPPPAAAATSTSPTERKASSPPAAPPDAPPSHPSDVVLEDGRVPADHRLGDPPGQALKEGQAPRGAMGALGALERTRPVIGSFSLGIGRAALEYATEYAKDRIQ